MAITQKDIQELKRDYAKLQKKYNLPDYKILNIEFDIEKIAENKTEVLLREIRRKIEQRTGSFLKMLEEFINPTYASIASLTLIKSFTEEERKIIQRSYKYLVSLVLKSGVLETEYNEKTEADFIKEAIKKWHAAKKDLNILIKRLEKIWEEREEEREWTEEEEEPEKGKQKYFG